VREIIGLAPGVSEFAALSLIITNRGSFFITDTHVRPYPMAEELAEMGDFETAYIGMG